jgi:hypothetical protein
MNHGFKVVILIVAVGFTSLSSLISDNTKELKQINKTLECFIAPVGAVNE